MKKTLSDDVEEAKKVALEVLRHNAQGPYKNLPRTAAWGYPEPYTRDLMIASLGILGSGDDLLLSALRRTLETLASNQSRLGHIPSLAHDPDDRGASDTTPLFLIATALFRKTTREQSFLEPAVSKALRWMEYQSPADDGLVGQLPTSDWRDEQWVLGYGLYVNTITYASLRLFEQHDRADTLRKSMGHLAITGNTQHRHVHEGLRLSHKPYYALWSYKVLRNERFDLLGNSLAVLTGIASPSRAKELVGWVEAECKEMRKRGDLSVDLPPCLFPFMQPSDPDWRPRDNHYNQPGEYHNGGVWPFVCGFYVAALVAAGKPKLAANALVDLTRLIKKSRKSKLAFGFNEWYRAQDGTPQGEDWQTWSAAMYLYAARCVEEGCTPFFDTMRTTRA